MRPSTVAIIGAPLDLGQDRRGVNMGPSAVRVVNRHKRVAALGYAVEDLGNIPVEQAESVSPDNVHAKYLPGTYPGDHRVPQDAVQAEAVRSSFWAADERRLARIKLSFSTCVHRRSSAASSSFSRSDIRGSL